MTEETNNLTDEQFIAEILALDELSKKTLGSYVYKAASHRTNISQERSKTNDDSSKIGDIYHNTHDKETRNHLDKARDSTNSKRDKLDRKDSKRSLGMFKALDKLTKEDQDKVNQALDLIEQFSKSPSTNLVEAIMKGDAASLDAIFDEVMQEKVSAQLVGIQESVAKGLFNQPSEDDILGEELSIDEGKIAKPQIDLKKHSSANKSVRVNASHQKHVDAFHASLDAGDDAYNKSMNTHKDDHEKAVDAANPHFDKAQDHAIAHKNASGNPISVAKGHRHHSNLKHGLDFDHVKTD